MENVFRVCLFITGLINILPSAIAMLPSKIRQSYGVNIPDANYELLLRHRAVLFGIVGGIMIYAAITKKNYTLAAIIGLVSMVSFVILSKVVNGDINPELHKVLQVDIVAIIILLAGLALYKFF